MRFCAFVIKKCKRGCAVAVKVGCCLVAHSKDGHIGASFPAPALSQVVTGLLAMTVITISYHPRVYLYHFSFSFFFFWFSLNSFKIERKTIKTFQFRVNVENIQKA